jgi:branched-chain amino acid transport system substrate-binding protein
MHRRNRRKSLAALTALLIFLSTLILASTAIAQEGAWELRVCADPASPPFSTRELTGFENRLAALLAEELDATLTVDWYPQGNDMIQLRLRDGHCDLIMGVPEGYRELLTTIAYYRSPYVFVYPRDSGLQIESLDDEALRELRIGVQNVGIPPHDALVNRGLSRNVVIQFGPEDELGATNSYLAMVNALIEGNIDIGIAWGPVAGYQTGKLPVEMTIVPVKPEVDPPFLSMAFAMSMAMRPGDEALRDRLNIAIANRWEDIQAILAEFEVPTAPLPKPVVSRSEQQADLLKVGLVGPTQTGFEIVHSSIYDFVGEAARNGALMAESDIANGGESALSLKVLTASAPRTEAARRAAERLLTTERPTALIGGVGAQGAVLAEVAERHGVPFFNIGDVSRSLRQECRPTTFHIEASAGMYLDALVEWFSDRGQRWFVVHPDDDEGEALLERAEEAIRRHGKGGRLVGAVPVAVEQPAYYEELAAIEESNAEVVLLLLSPADQMAFMGQQQTVGPDVAFAPFPHPVAQTRDFLAASRSAAAAGDTDRVLLWETTLEEGEAGTLNQRYMSRWGLPLEPAGWASYLAVRLLSQSVEATGSTDSAGLIAYLESPDTSFQAKNTELSFRPWDHQLRQPLYVVEVIPTAEWQRTLTNVVSFARLKGTLPIADETATTVEWLDRLGDTRETTACE